MTVRAQTASWGLAAALAIFIAASWWPGYQRFELPAASMRPMGGHSYYVESIGFNPPRLFRIASDDNDRRSVSELALLENGQAFGRPHASQADIGSNGGGLYSHWGAGLYFSTPDNTDPRSNGRTYAVSAPLRPRNAFWIALAIVLLSVTLPVWARISVHARAPLVRSAPAAAIAAVGGVTLYLIYAAFVDRSAALTAARQLTAASALLAVCAALAVVIATLLDRGARTWRLVIAIAVLYLTAFVIYLRPEVYLGRALPGASIILAPLVLGVVLRYARPALWVDRARHPFPVLTRWHPLAPAIALALLLAAPMIISPVVENWNASGWMDSHGYDTYAHNILTGKRPEGSSQYMPVYQYGLAAVYYVFGHFFFAAQLVNVLLTFLTVVLLCLSAWNLFRNVWAVLLIGVWVAFARQMQYAVFFTQIEAWYTPIVAFTIFAWTCYWRTPSRGHLLLLAVAAGIGLNTRNQGAFYFAWLGLAPLFIAMLPWRRRVAHAAIALAILAVSLVPWSLRNYAVDGRFSPSPLRNGYYLGVLNDPRIGLYGLRYWEGWGEIVEDYERRYPDPVERDRVMMRTGLSTPFVNFDWFVRAVYWRSLAFYGLLPNGVFDPAGPRPSDWSQEWWGYLYWRTIPLTLLPLSLLGVVTRPGRVTFFLLAAAAAQLAIVAAAGGSEDRVSYPVLPLHMLLALAAIFEPRRPELNWSIGDGALSMGRPHSWAVIVVAAAVFLLVMRLQFGAPNGYAPLVERNVDVSTDVALNDDLPRLEDLVDSLASPLAQISPDTLVRARLIVMNYQCPPKFGGPIDYMPSFATDPARETYYYAYLPVRGPKGIEQVPIGVAWFGATLSDKLREGDEAEIEGRVVLATENPIARYWLVIEKARKVYARSTAVPTFR